MSQPIDSTATEINIVINHTLADEDNVQEGTSTMSDVVDSESSDTSFSRGSTPDSLSEEVPSATDGSAEAFIGGECTNTSALPVPLFRPKGKATLPTTNKPTKPNKPNKPNKPTKPTKPKNGST
ncbi:uncharacterized protein FOMMEDRAFT_170582 [Fomitiporia mediterranea MF3/22]|uniref:uncharacterized protein n=1 Tax=Fomitiporia mediterranea (strain MF3/22) TaxID=694068 RepID=UPI00044075CE|nr:uncharacterized protein FOMMEDRAFT_170582 [Fomitiporia mediterranea MF3/22]EJC99268.1 hypothetical protein FOMMEDRAFT_170582 [Fomitiporia mediterranea MF3/22]